MKKDFMHGVHCLAEGDKEAEAMAGAEGIQGWRQGLQLAMRAMIGDRSEEWGEAGCSSLGGWIRGLWDRKDLPGFVI